MSDSLQDRYSPKGACFGCGPTNDRGLRVKSHVVGEEVIADWMPEKHHEAFENILAGGIIGTLLDCHSNWAAAYYLMKRAGLDEAPCTVTAEYSVKLKRPAPTKGPVHLVAKLAEISDDRAVIEATLEAGGKICATCRGTFVAVKPDHPAFHRW